MPYSYDKAKFPERANEYVIYLSSVTDRSPLTIEGYIRDLRLFFEYIAKEKGYINNSLISKENKNEQEQIDLSFIDDKILSEITLKDIHSFLAYCNSERNNSAVTRSRKSSSIKGFFKYIADKMNYIDHNPASQLQVTAKKKELPKYLTLEQSKALLAAVNGANKERDYCILTLFLNCGLRLAELVGLNLSDFNLDEKTLRVTGKGNKQRVLYLNKACVDAIMGYLNVRQHDGVKGEDRNALFLSRLNKRLGRLSVQQMVYRYLAAIGLDGNHYSVHKLRHTAATLMYQYGNADVLVIKDVLGHENLSTTEIYTHLQNEQVKDAIMKNPLSGEQKSDNHEE